MEVARIGHLQQDGGSARISGPKAVSLPTPP